MQAGSWSGTCLSPQKIAVNETPDFPVCLGAVRPMIQTTLRMSTLLCSLFVLSCQGSPAPAQGLRLAVADPKPAARDSPCEAEPKPPKDPLSDVFSFGAWKGELSERDGRCLLSLKAFGLYRDSFEQVLDLRPPCYVSRWSGLPFPNSKNPKDKTITYGGPGDAQVWQLGRDPATAVLITSIVGFEPNLANPADREPKHFAKRCGNAAQYIRIKGGKAFSLGEAFASPRFVECAIQTFDLKAFIIGAEDLIER